MTTPTLPGWVDPRIQTLRVLAIKHPREAADEDCPGCEAVGLRGHARPCNIGIDARAKLARLAVPQ